MNAPVTRLLLAQAWVDAAVREDVLVEIDAGRFTRVEVGAVSTGAPRVHGLTLPGLANTHSHVFHRALRGRVQGGRVQGGRVPGGHAQGGHAQGGHGSFWGWREEMYALAARLDPDSLHRLARAVYAEMVAAGITCVGEFHYLHHGPDGQAYDDPNAMGRALVAAASEVGLRLTLLDTAYLAAGIGQPVEGVQQRFSDGDAEAWAVRQEAMAAALVPRTDARSGTAIHSVRAVPREQVATVVEAGERRPRHVHLSEQLGENDACVAAYGITPTALLAESGVWGPLSTAVHATHLTGTDVETLGRTQTHVSFCPTTERDLADGIGPAGALTAAGAKLTLGSDSHAVIDLFEEMRAVELHERLVSHTRGRFTAADLLESATVTGHSSLGWYDAGSIAVGHRADLVELDPVSPRTAGTGADERTAVFAATSADVERVMVGGQWRFTGDRAAVGRDLDRVITELWEETP